MARLPALQPDHGMSSSFYETHRANVLFNAVVGFCVPGLPRSSPRLQRLLHYYSRTSAAVAVVHLPLLLLGLPKCHNLSTFCVSFIQFFICLMDAMASVFYIVYEARFVALMADFERVTALCAADPLSKVDFLARLRRNSNFLRIASSKGPWLVSFVAITFYTPNLIRSAGWFGLDGKRINVSEMWTPCDDTQTPCYEIFYAVSIVTTIPSVLKRLCFELFFMVLFNIKHSCLEHILDSFGNVFIPDDEGEENIESSKDKAITEMQSVDLPVSEFEGDNHFRTCPTGKTAAARLKTWTELHRQVLRLGEDSCRLHAPIFTAYLGQMICLITITLFLLTDTDFEMPFTQTFMAASYGLALIATLGVMCVIGDGMTQVSMDIASPEFCGPWYTASRSAKSCMLIVLSRTRKPLESRSVFPGAKLNKETFVALCNLMLSYYLALKQIKKSGSV